MSRQGIKVNFVQYHIFGFSVSKSFKKRIIAIMYNFIFTLVLHFFKNFRRISIKILPILTNQFGIKYL